MRVSQSSKDNVISENETVFIRVASKHFFQEKKKPRGIVFLLFFNWPFSFSLIELKHEMSLDFYFYHEFIFMVG